MTLGESHNSSVPYLGHKQNGTWRQNNLALHSRDIKSISVNYFQNAGARGGIFCIDRSPSGLQTQCLSSMALMLWFSKCSFQTSGIKSLGT